MSAPVPIADSCLKLNWEDGEVDPAITQALPSVGWVLGVTKVADSAWAAARRIIVEQTDGKQESYFVKVSFGHHGREALKGEYESTAAIHAISPDLCPKPIAWGTFQDDENAHFFVCKYYNFEPNVLPPMESFCEKVALLHKSNTSPEGKFGFHCVTYNGDIPQDNTWCNSWEVFFSRGLRHVLNVREERAGPDPELNELIPALFDKVIPRLLRPMETGGRKVIPSLVHGDLWCGSVGVDKATGGSVIYDPSSFWAHNECELGNWRPSRNNFQSRFNVHASALFWKDDTFLNLVKEDMRVLIAKYPGGYVGEAEDRCNNHGPQADGSNA